jgi:hypothetical protein
MEQCLSNLNHAGHPTIPEVFLDESFCYLGHHANLTWKPAYGVSPDSGHRPMLAIFGAFVVWSKRNRVCEKIVRDSLLIWPTRGLAQMGNKKRKRGPEAQDEELWQSLPQYIRDAQIAPDSVDYHGNFSSKLFEKIFERICQTWSRFLVHVISIWTAPNIISV